jgi:hypothetical protein
VQRANEVKQFPKGKKGENLNLAKSRLEKKNCTDTFVQTAIITICTYNVGDQLPIDVEFGLWTMEQVSTNEIHILVTK